jgi:integrase
LRKLVLAVENGEHVDPSKLTVAEYLTDWLRVDTNISPKTRERYRQLAQHQIIPHLGTLPLQKLKPTHIEPWHRALLDSGLSTVTIGNAHRVLHRALQRATEDGVVARNVVSVKKPPKVDGEEVEILTEDQVSGLLKGLEGHPLHAIAVFALATGCRRGEICALTWGCVDLEAGTVTVRQALEQTDAGLRLKEPKSKSGRRTITLPQHAVEMLSVRYREAMELRLKLGIGGRPGDDDWVFPGSLDGSQPYPPDRLSLDWGRAIQSHKLPPIKLHALRHTHVSALIAAGQDVVSVSKRIGHSNPSITLSVYSHLFSNKSDAAAAAAIERLFR